MNNKLKMTKIEFQNLKGQMKLNDSLIKKKDLEIDKLNFNHDKNETMNFLEGCSYSIVVLLIAVSVFSYPIISICALSICALKESLGFCIDKLCKKDIYSNFISLYNRLKIQNKILDEKEIKEKEKITLENKKEGLRNLYFQVDEQLSEIQKQINIEQQNFVPIIDARYDEKVKVHKLGSYKK